MRIWLVGKIGTNSMTGARELSAFNSVASRLEQRGHQVVNPLELPAMGDATWNEIAKRDLLEMLTCGGYALLDGWEDSISARLQEQVGRVTGMKRVQV